MPSNTKKKINDVKISSNKKLVSGDSKSKTKRKLQDVKLDKIKKILIPKTTRKILSPAKKILKVLHRNKKSAKKIIKKKIVLEKGQILKLNKIKNNPIISPSHYSWESKATFNPAVFSYDDDIHLVYRAIGDDDSSVLGYARSVDGINIIERPSYFIYKRPPKPNRIGKKIVYSSGGSSSGGCEDPRIVLIDGVLYLSYTAFDGWNSIRMALTSISISDFKNKKWNWRIPVFISPEGEIHKNWVIFPEKINGKYAIMHSISPDILIDYIDDLRQFNGERFINSIHADHPKWKEREKGIRGVGPTPIKTKDGWLVFYHKTEQHEPNKYKIFAMILDYQNPTKILYKTKYPILEPEEDFEMEGYRGIVYSCGSVIKGKNLFVYYGGGDKHVCVASINLDEFLNKIKEDKIIKLKNKKELITK